MADTLALVWPRTSEGPLRGTAVRGGEAVGPAFAVDAPVTGEALKKAMAKAGVTAKRAVVALPRSLATIRRLDLPDVQDDDLPDLVRMQAATKSAAPLDQLAYDFLPLPRSTDPEHAAKRAAMLATVPASLFERVKQVVGAAGLELTTVGLNADGVARLVAKQSPAEGRTLVVARDGEFAELSLLNVTPGGVRLVHSHSAHPSGEDEVEWERALLSECNRVLISHASGAADGLAAVWGIGQKAEAFVPRLAERFECESHVASRWDALGLSGNAGEVDPGVFSGAVGHAAGATEVPGLDFLSPRRRSEPEDTRLRTALLAATALTVLIGAGWFVLYRQKSDLREDIQILEAQIEDDELFIERNEPYLAEDAAVGAWNAESTDARAELARLDALLPGTDRMFLETFQLSPPTTRSRATVRADGFANSEQLVREVERDLAAAGYVVRPTQTGRVTGRPGYPVKFSLSVELPAPEDSNPEPVGSAAA